LVHVNMIAPSSLLAQFGFHACNSSDMSSVNNQSFNPPLPTQWPHVQSACLTWFSSTWPPRLKIHGIGPYNNTSLGKSPRFLGCHALKTQQI
jgi:hypothetical protein